MLRAFALMRYETSGHHDSGPAAFLHRDPQVARAQGQLHGMVEELLADGARDGSVRGDVPPGELAAYCLHALTAAGGLPSRAAVLRLVTVTLDGVRSVAAAPDQGAIRTDAP